MRPVLQLMERVAPSDANVLITGEHGTGKEVVAQWIHAASPRAARPLVAVNLGGLSEGLFESEMFGHVKGAFTDARADRIGRFELAEGGTLFLDEIGTLEPRQQAKLLRVLETGEVERVGASRARQVDVRILSATNADLPAEVAAGGSARICSSGSTPSRSACRRCASAARTSRRWPQHFLRRYADALPQAARRASSPRRSRRSRRTPGPATCASSTTRSSARCCMAHGPRVRAADLGLRGGGRRARGSRTCRSRRWSACSSARRSSATAAT